MIEEEKVFCYPFFPRSLKHLNSRHGFPPGARPVLLRAAAQEPHGPKPR